MSVFSVWMSARVQAEARKRGWILAMPRKLKRVVCILHGEKLILDEDYDASRQHSHFKFCDRCMQEAAEWAMCLRAEWEAITQYRQPRAQRDYHTHTPDPRRMGKLPASFGGKRVRMG